MAWIKTIPFEDADENLKELLGKLQSTYPSEYNEPVPAASATNESVISSHTLMPDAMFHIFAGYSSMLSSDLPLERRQHEIIATIVSAANDCFY